MWNPGGQTGRRRLVPGIKPQITTEGSNIIFIKPCLNERCFYSEFMDGLQTGPSVFQIIGIGSIKENLDVSIMHHIKKLFIHPKLAMVTVFLGIIHKFFPGKRLQVDSMKLNPWKAMAAKPTLGTLLFLRTDKTAAGKEHQHIAGAQDIKSRFQQKRAVDPAGKGHGNPCIVMEK